VRLNGQELEWYALLGKNWSRMPYRARTGAVRLTGGAGAVCLNRQELERYALRAGAGAVHLNGQELGRYALGAGLGAVRLTGRGVRGQAYIDGLSIFTEASYGWSASQCGIMLGVLGLAAPILNQSVGRLSSRVSDRAITVRP
jgi:hypothetical protein